MRKHAILDPEGQAVADVLRGMGMPVEDVRVGRRIQLTLDARSAQEARNRAIEMARGLLANPVLETFEVEDIPS